MKASIEGTARPPAAAEEKPFSLEDLIRVIARRRVALAVTFVACSLAGTLWALNIPNQYEATAVLVVEPPQYPSGYISPEVAPGIAEAFAPSEKALLATERVRPFVERHEVYHDSRLTRALRRVPVVDRIVEKVLKTPDDEFRLATVVKPSGRFDKPMNYIEVTHRAESARAAGEIANELAASLGDIFHKFRVDQVERIIAGLSDELRSADANLSEQDRKIRAFNLAHAESLPDQEALLIGRLTNVDRDYAENRRALEAAETRRDQVALQLGDLATNLKETIDELLALETQSGGDARRELEEKVRDARASEARAEQNVLALRAMLTPKHPDVVMAESMRAQAAAETARLRAALKALESKPPEAPSSRAAPSVAEVDPADPGPTGRAHPLADPRLSQSQVKRIQKTPIAIRYQDAVYEWGALGSRIETLKREGKWLGEERLKVSLLLQKVPEVRSELDGLVTELRMRRAIRDATESHLKNAKLALSMENADRGQRLAMLNRAEAPRTPVAPNRLKLVLASILVSLGAGLAVAFWREMRDHSVKAPEEVIDAGGLPLLAVIPRLGPREDQGGTFLVSGVRRALTGRWSNGNGNGNGGAHGGNGAAIPALTHGNGHGNGSGNGNGGPAATAPLAVLKTSPITPVPPLASPGGAPDSEGRAP